MKKRIKTSFSLHHWCGLIAGIFLLTISLSGAVLVFHDEIDQAAFAAYSKLPQPARTLKIDRSFEHIRKANPAWEIRIPALPRNANEALKYELRQQSLRKWIFVHPETGAVLHTEKHAEKRLVHTFLMLHYTLFAKSAGKIVVLLCGLAFFTLTITGFVLYRKAIFKVLTFRQKISGKSRRAFFSSLHRIIGVWSLVFNLAMSVSGIWLAYLVVENALKSKAQNNAIPAVPVSIDKMLQAVKVTYPEFDVYSLRFPAKEDGSIQFLGHLKTDPAIYGEIYSSLQANYKTGRIEKTEFLQQKPWNQRLAKMLQVLHFGNYAGKTIKILYVLFGLTPGLLAVSGFIIWLYRGKNLASPKQKNRQHTTLA